MAGWKPLVSAALFANILDQLVLPKLRRAIEQWNPRRDSTPIHHWTHPWLPVVGGRLDGLLPMIKHKLATVLTDWTADDATAHVVVAPWKAVFTKPLWDSLLLDKIVPKLAHAMRAMEINPAGQDLAPLGWLHLWLPDLGREKAASVVVHELLYRWLGVLHDWLSRPAPNGADLGEVERWYSGWKQALGAELLSDQAVKRIMAQALRMMEQKLTDQPIVMPPPPPVSHAASVTMRAAARAAPSAAAPARPAAGIPSSVRSPGHPKPTYQPECFV